MRMLNEIRVFLSEKNHVSELKDAVMNTKVTGALLDSYVAGYWANSAPDPVLKDTNLRVGTVIDKQFAYGFVIAGALQNPATEKCMRKKLNSMETEITTIIQEKAQTMEVQSFYPFTLIPWGVAPYSGLNMEVAAYQRVLGKITIC